MATDQLPMFSSATREDEYVPRPAPLFRPRQIILSKGSVATTSRRRFVESICDAYPTAQVIEQLMVPHNKLSFDCTDPLELHYRGHRALVLGEHKSAVGRSNEVGNTCPNFWHFSPYGYCPYGCQYCYLAGTQGVRFSPSVKIFVNLDEILREVDQIAQKFQRPDSFYLGKLQDGMALDSLTGYSRQMIRFFAGHPTARLRILSKSADFQNVLDLDHRGHTVLCWSLNPPAVRDEYEAVTPTIERRINAMEQCAKAGYPIRVMLMPIIPIPNWQQHYDAFLEQLLGRVKLDRLTLGAVCSYGPAMNLMERKLGVGNPVSCSLSVINNAPSDGRARYPHDQRRSIYEHLLRTIRKFQPYLTCALCMEDVSLAKSLGVGDNIGRCNCIH